MQREPNYGYNLLPSEDVDARVDETFDLSRSLRKAKYDRGVRYDLSKDPWVIHPHSTSVQLWNVFISSILLVDMVYLPVETAFSQRMQQDFVWTVNILSSIFLSLDICLQFFLEIRSPSGEYWIVNHGRIIRTYLSGFFLLDLISVIPLREVFMAITFLYSERSAYIAHLLQFLRLIRLLRLRHVIYKYQYDVDISYVTRTVLYSGITIFLNVHWMSCVWATLGNYQSGQSWLRELEQGKLQYASEPTETLLSTYFTATYFALYTLTGIGYGDIVPTTQVEYLCTVAMMLVGSLVWATIIGEIVNVIQHSNADKLHHQNKMDTVLDMCTEHSLSNVLLLRLQDYFTQLQIVQRTRIMQTTLSRMNSELAVEFVYVIHKAWLERVWWLAQVAKTPFMAQLSLDFCPLLYCPKECIVTGDRLYVVQKGLVIHGRQVLSKDMVWGTDMLLLQSHLRVDRLTLAISYVHVNYLARDALVMTMERFPQEQRLLRRAYRNLVVLRGMVWYAKQIKAHELLMEQLQQEPERLSGGQRRSRLATDTRVGHILSIFRQNNAEEELETPEKAVEDLRERMTAIEDKLDKRLEDIGTQLTEVMDVVSQGLEQLKKRGASKRSTMSGWMRGSQ